jgi:hypothetical protein
MLMMIQESNCWLSGIWPTIKIGDINLSAGWILKLTDTVRPNLNYVVDQTEIGWEIVQRFNLAKFKNYLL